MKKLLPFQAPPIKTFNYLAYEIGITLTNDESLPWFHMNYFLLCCPKTDLHLEDHKLGFSLLDNPFLSKIHLSKSFIQDITDPIQFITISLNHGYYVNTFVNEYFIPNRRAYHLESYLHDILIIGYDSVEMILNVVGYNSKGQFVSDNVSYDDFRNSFIYCTSSKEQWLDRFELIIPKKQEFQFNISFILNQIEDFLNGKNDAKFKYFEVPIKERDAYGKDVYEYIISYIKENTTYWDIRFFHLLLEHKVAQLERIKFLEKKGFIKNIDELIISNEKLVETANILFNITLKFNITSAFGNNEKDKLIALIKQLEQQEEDILKSLIIKIKQLL
ncbi:hypothetical protein [Paenibacillus tundrae]|uniref:hypothetical protein n=1 Tax=Paenibacillus tundrae TaxID=528187 RepID=UPI0022A949EB|nr:hypothetical protein [Paenibacillus tundrae]MCZ1264758.1 hypothetical protein [Paenibacillus tundrae]